MYKIIIFCHQKVLLVYHSITLLVCMPPVAIEHVSTLNLSSFDVDSGIEEVSVYSGCFPKTLIAVILAMLVQSRANRCTNEPTAAVICL